MTSNKMHRLKALMSKITTDLAAFERQAKAMGLQPSIQFIDETDFGEISEFTSVLAVSDSKNEWTFPFSQCESCLEAEHVKVFMMGGFGDEKK